MRRLKLALTVGILLLLLLLIAGTAQAAKDREQELVHIVPTIIDGSEHDSSASVIDVIGHELSSQFTPTEAGDDSGDR